GQRIFLVRLAIVEGLPLGGPLHDHPDCRDVQHVQQQEPDQPADHAGAVQLRRLPASGSGRSAPVATGREAHILRTSKHTKKTEQTESLLTHFRLFRSLHLITSLQLSSIIDVRLSEATPPTS